MNVQSHEKGIFQRNGNVLQYDSFPEGTNDN